MKQLQNNFTTPEQSKRLLELGLPQDSADFMLQGKINKEWLIYHLGGKFYSQWFKDDYYNYEYYPCWSVGRLIEIELTCREQRERQVARLTFYAEDMPSDLSATNIMESLIAYMERGEFKYDFSKLER